MGWAIGCHETTNADLNKTAYNVYVVLTVTKATKLTPK